jgi:hypothetical protein
MQTHTGLQQVSQNPSDNRVEELLPCLTALRVPLLLSATATTPTPTPMSTRPPPSSASKKTRLLSPSQTRAYERWMDERGRLNQIKSGESGASSLPSSWKNVTPEQKRELLHALACEVEGYTSAYINADPHALIDSNTHSVEHVLPIAMMHDDDDDETTAEKAGVEVLKADTDPLNWIMAHRSVNINYRKSLPLLLWSRENASTIRFLNRNGFQKVYLKEYDETLFEPPENQKARLARKWLYARVTYHAVVDPPSRAQLAHLSDIIALAKYTPISKVEIKMSEKIYQKTGLRNPLINQNSAIPNRFYDSQEWRSIFYL